MATNQCKITELRKHRFVKIAIAVLLLWLCVRSCNVYLMPNAEEPDAHIIKDFTYTHIKHYTLSNYSKDAKLVLSGQTNGTFRVLWEGSKDGTFSHIIDCQYLKHNGVTVQEKIDFVLPKDTLSKYNEVFIVVIPESATEGEVRAEIKDKWYEVVKKQLLRFWHY